MLPVLLITGPLTVSLSILLFIIFRNAQKKKPLSHLRTKSHQSKCVYDKISQKQVEHIVSKLNQIVEKEKKYTNASLSIQDLASEIGTNRTYISSTINKFYNQNFCTYINQYRFQELNKTIRNNTSYTYRELASCCGFGSVDSMKRVVKIRTGLSFKDWKDSIHNTSDVNRLY